MAAVGVEMQAVIVMSPGCPDTAGFFQQQGLDPRLFQAGGRGQPSRTGADHDNTGATHASHRADPDHEVRFGPVVTAIRFARVSVVDGATAP
jgi:hypothetical protein